jgi:DNA-directed RNA polymerase specialized sigma24 family protein
MENRRKVLRSSELDENSAEINSKAVAEDLTEESGIKDKRFKCLDVCLAKFPEDKRELLVKYFDTEEETMIPTRRSLAEKMGININTLRIRISRLKSKLEKCTKECCKET